VSVFSRCWSYTVSMEVLGTPASPGSNVGSDSLLPDKILPPGSRPFTPRPSNGEYRRKIDRQRLGEYDIEHSDHVYDIITPRIPLRTATLPDSRKHRAVDRVRHEEDGRAFGNPSRQSTGWTDGSAPFEDTAPWDKKSILSLDGGGIRGYSALLILQELMRHIETLERNYRDESTGAVDPVSSSYHPLHPDPKTVTDTRGSNGETSAPNQLTDSSHWLPCHYFDYIAGTSTGGLIGIMLGRLRMNIDDCISDYEDFGARVFGRKRWVHVRSLLWWPRDRYSHKALENVVKEVVDKRVPKVPQFPGGQNFSSDENRCRTVVLSYQQIDDEDASKAGVETPYFFRTYRNYRRSETMEARPVDRNPGPAHDIPIWEVARATSAAPGYFKPPIIMGKEYLDGGFGSNNPCEEIYEEVRTMNNHAENCTSIILSIGTGKAKGLRRMSKASGLSRYLNLINVAVKFASESEEPHVRMLRRTRDRGDASMKYLRLNVEDGIGNMKLDEWRARGSIRTKIGLAIGKFRSTRCKTSVKTEEKISAVNGNASTEDGGVKFPSAAIHHAFAQNGHAAGYKGPIPSVLCAIPQADSSPIPCFFQPKNKTLDSIREHTNAYLNDPEVQQNIQEVAALLVKGRRKRAAQDPQRWKKTCFGAWYNCKVLGCPRGEYDYQRRERMRHHLVERHPEKYSMNRQEQLDEALDAFEIVTR